MKGTNTIYYSYCICNIVVDDFLSRGKAKPDINPMNPMQLHHISTGANHYDLSEIIRHGMARHGTAW